MMKLFGYHLIKLQSYLNIEDMAKALNIEIYYSNIPSNLSTTMILNYLEFASNIVMLCDIKMFE